MMHLRGKSTIEFNESIDDDNNESKGIYKKKRMPTINKKAHLHWELWSVEIVATTKSM
jgi:hypothetical protein